MSGLLWSSTAHPIGANSTLFKLCRPYNYAYADIIGAMIVGLSIFSVVSAWGNNLCHKCSGNVCQFLPQLLGNDLWMCQFVFWIFFLCLGGGTFLYLIPIHCIVSRNASDASLSRMCFFTCTPLCCIGCMSLLYALHIYPDIKIFIGSTRISFPSYLHSTMM